MHLPFMHVAYPFMQTDCRFTLSCRIRHSQAQHVRLNSDLWVVGRLRLRGGLACVNTATWRKVHMRSCTFVHFHVRHGPAKYSSRESDNWTYRAWTCPKRKVPYSVNRRRQIHIIMFCMKRYATWMNGSCMKVWINLTPKRFCSQFFGHKWWIYWNWYVLQQ